MKVFSGGHLFRLLLLVSIGAPAASAQSPASIPLEKGVEVAGVYQRPAGAALILLALDGQASEWISAGTTWSGYTYVGYDSTRDEVSLRSATGDLHKIRPRVGKVAKADPIQMPVELLPAEKVNWAWVRSDRNPMQRRAVDLPFEIVMEWDTYAEADKIPLLNYYREHGWSLRVTHLPTGIQVRLEPLEDPSNPRPRNPPPSSLPGVPLNKQRP